MRQTAARCFVFAIGLFSLVQAAGGQRAATAPPNAPTVQLWTSADLNQQAKSLLAQAAAANGSAGATLTRLPNQYTMLTTRDRSGGAELRSGLWCDYLIVLQGEGVELTGGSMSTVVKRPTRKCAAPGSKAPENYPLHKGDVISIPAGTPHQAIEAPGQNLTLFVIKTPAPARP